MIDRASPTALITGVTGQDGWYLAERLQRNGERVVGLARRASAVPDGVALHTIDVRDARTLGKLVRQVEPCAIYHLAADSAAARSWQDPSAARDAIVSGTHSVLDAWAAHAASAAVVIASSSEVFAGSRVSPQDEHTPLAPTSPYGEGKAAALDLARSVRAATGGRISVAILYNHESPRRHPDFLSRKVTMGVAAIIHGRARELVLGSLTSRRDWGFAGDYVDALARMALHPEAGDYLIGTGVSRTVAELCQVAFGVVGLDYRDYVRSDPALVRGVDPSHLVANPAHAREVLGWLPTTSFEAMVTAMVEADLVRVARGEA